MQFIHRSVGEPAEGSLTRYPTLTNANCFSNLSSREWADVVFGVCWKGLFREVHSYYTYSEPKGNGMTAVSAVKTNSCAGPTLLRNCNRYPINLFHLFASWLLYVVLFTVYSVQFTRLIIWTLKIQLLAMDILVLATMKNAAKCDT